MNVVQSIQALREHADQLPDLLPLWLVEKSAGSVVAALLKPAESEELQQRANREWVVLLAEESDPLEAAKLLLDWVADQNQARVREAGYREEVEVPDSQRLSRG